jgi:hypothetical protein
MWYQHILIELLAVLPLLQPHIRISSGSSLHCAEGFKTVVRGVHSILLHRKEKKWLKVGASPNPTNYLWGPEKKWLKVNLRNFFLIEHFVSFYDLQDFPNFQDLSTNSCADGRGQTMRGSGQDMVQNDQIQRTSVYMM